MKFSELVGQVRDWLERERRVSYRALKREFDLDDEDLEDLKAELIDAKHLASDEDGKVLVWIGDGINGEKDKWGKGEKEVVSSQLSVASSSQPPTLQTPNSELRTFQSPAERRQLTVMFCDLVGSTALSEQLDPEELREVVRAYHETCAGVISRYAGHTAQHLGDGLLVYFSYPAAHEDDAQRAVRTGLEILAGLQALNAQLPPTLRAHLPRLIQVRIGVHTGLVVIGEIGSSEKREVLALGETPNIAARLQSLAEPDTVVISAVTQRLVTGLFESQDLGPQTLKGISIPLSVYQVIRESTAHSRFEVAVQVGLTPLVGRDLELGLLRERWAQAKDGAGQVVLLSGEPGIGKSRLVQELKTAVTQAGSVRIEYRCSSYHQNSALYPLVEHMQRVLHVTPGDTPQDKLRKLEQTLSRYRFPQSDTVPLLATLLSLPQPEGSPPLALSPQQQKQKTLDALVRWLFEEAERAPVYAVWEDLHWADPSTLEFLTACLDQTPTARMLMVLTFRPEFMPTWSSRSHMSHLVLSRLGQQQSSAIVEGVTGGKTLTREIVQQIVSKTDGVPLFVEELTKSVLESVEVHGSVPLQSLAIPSTLHDSLMARLDRLGPAKEIAQMGATIGREFTSEVLQAVSPLTETALQRGLKQLVEAELVYQSGLPPQARYLFKHALVQDTAYQSLLKSRRQQLHQQVAQVLEAKFPQTVETQPELVAHHYTEAGLTAQAIPYWQKAGQRAVQRSAHAEAISHLTKGLELLKTLPDTPEHAQQELMLQLAFSVPLMATKGWSAQEVKRVYARARELCQQLGETPQLFTVLFGLWMFYTARAEHKTACELVEQCLTLAQSIQDADFLLEAHCALGVNLFHLGELVPSRAHFEQGTALYDPQQHHSHAFLYGHDPGVWCLFFAAWVLWYIGYPDQALKRSQEAITLAQEISHPFSLGYAFFFDATLHQFRREARVTQERAEAAITFSIDQGFPELLEWGTLLRGWALTEQGQGAEGLAQIRQSLAADRATELELFRPYHLALLAEACRKAGRVEAGLTALAEALAVVDKTVERRHEAELYRLKGELTLQSKTSLRQVSDKSQASPEKSEDTGPRLLTPDSQAEAEACFLKAIDIARKQQAKSLELRATTSLARLWQQQDKKAEAHDLLAEIYGWFTEGFDTKDLQEAKMLLEELSH